MWSSERRGPAAAALVAALVATLLAGGTASAQGVVRGTIELVQRPTADAADLRDAIIWLEPRSHTLPAGRTAPEDGTIHMREREFRPHITMVRVGGSVAFPNEDPFSHNVFSNADGGAFDLGLYRRGATRAATFPRAGVYPVYCNIHSKMVSFVLALPAALVVRADEAGRFVVDDVPAGAYVLHAWHERGASELSQPLTVTAEGAQVRVTLDAHAYVTAPHFNKFGRPYSLLRADRY